jgi:hypothetical protein
MEEEDRMVRISIVIPESKRERFFMHCRRLKPRKSMNAVINDLIDGVLGGRIPVESQASGKGKRKE